MKPFVSARAVYTLSRGGSSSWSRIIGIAGVCEPGRGLRRFGRGRAAAAATRHGAADANSRVRRGDAAARGAPVDHRADAARGAPRRGCGRRQALQRRRERRGAHARRTGHLERRFAGLSRARPHVHAERWSRISASSRRPARARLLYHTDCARCRELRQPAARCSEGPELRSRRARTTQPLPER